MELAIKGGLLFSLKPKIPESIRGTTNVIKHQPPADLLQTMCRLADRTGCILSWQKCGNLNFFFMPKGTHYLLRVKFL